MNVAVLGASGYVGSHLVPALLEGGHSVRAASRRPEVLEGRGWDGASFVQADALDEDSLTGLLEGCEVACYLVHSMAGGAGFAKRDATAAANFALAVAAAGVRRVVYLGGLEPAGGASAHLASRMETGNVLRKGPVPVTELRAGIIVGPGSAGFEVIRDLVNHLPLMITPRWVQSKTQPIALRDLVAYLIGVIEDEETAGATFDVGGPEVLTYRELMGQYGEVTDRKVRTIPVPVLTPRLSSWWLDLVTSVPGSVARPLIEGLKSEIVVRDGDAIRRYLPRTLMTYREAVRDAIAEERAGPLPSRWTEGALAFRGYNPDVSFYSKGESVETPVSAPASAMWEVVRALGGKEGYHYADRLWRVRGLMDRAVGGIGMRRGRRHPTDVRVGDAIDFWRVVAVEEGRRLTLSAEMKLPGEAALEFEVRELDDSSCTLVTQARFHPEGVLGLLYWYAMAPAHYFIFRRMPLAMARAAEGHISHSR